MLFLVGFVLCWILTLREEGKNISCMLSRLQMAAEYMATSVVVQKAQEVQRALSERRSGNQLVSRPVEHARMLGRSSWFLEDLRS